MTGWKKKTITKTHRSEGNALAEQNARIAEDLRRLRRETMERHPDWFVRPESVKG